MSQEALTGLRAISLLRASSKQQTQKKQRSDGGVDYDIPLQRDYLTPWIIQQGMVHIKEFVEGGISGYRISAENRDKLQEIKQMAVRKEFDVLVIYMSDRLGRIADETPLVVSFLNKHGIRVISYTEGEIKADTHSDKLMTYIRYWQAEGESLKTSIRVSDAIEKSVENGKWRGGNLAYGYKAVSRGTLNFKGKPIFDVEIDEEQAEHVKTIFRLSRVENWGGTRIARYLNDNHVPTQQGGQWTLNTILQILRNPIYKGIYILHSRVKTKKRVVSPVMENFIIIPASEWEETQEKMTKRATRAKGKRNTTHGKLLLSGIIFCGTCGEKMTTLGCKSKYTKKNGEQVYRKNYKYICSSFFRPRTDKCPGQTTYSAKKIEAAVVADIKAFLSTINTKEIIDSYLSKLDTDAKHYAADLAIKQTAIPKAEAELAKLKEEIIKALMGTSAFSESMIKELLQKKEAEIIELRNAEDFLQNELMRIDAAKSTHLELSHELENWSELFDQHDLMKRKAMILNLVNRIDVYGERVEITYNITVDAFSTESHSEEFDTDGGNCYNIEGLGAEQAQTGDFCGMNNPYQAALPV